MAPAVERPMPGSEARVVEDSRHLAAELVAHPPRGAVQVARAAVVAEAGPGVQHLVGGGVGERADGRERSP